METKMFFKSYDGTKLVGILNKPERSIVKAAFLMMHGIPSDKDEWGFYKDMSVALEKENYASFRFDFRYNGESTSGNMDQLTISGMTNDIDAAYWQLRNTIGVNTSIFVVGTSCGGGVTIKWIHNFKRQVKRVFLMAPVFDYEYEIFGCDYFKSKDGNFSLPPELIDGLERNGCINSEIKYGRSMINEAHLFNAIDEISSITNNLTIFHGEEDTVVPIQKTERIVEKFIERIELIKIPHANHGFAVDGDEDLTSEGTKKNHHYVYAEIIKRSSNDS